jgi:biotin-dependent carboxylase-like uncharacterized protein
MTAYLRVLRAGAGVSLQDGGRFLLRRYGVTPSGPMDWTAFQTVHRVLGNDKNASALEISVGGIEVTCPDAPLGLAFAGGGFNWTRDGKPLPAAMRLRLQPGERLAARPGSFGAWSYLAVASGFDTRPEMGSRSMHSRSGIGGHMVQADDRLPISGAHIAIQADARIEAKWLQRDSQPIRVLLGPQDDYFSADSIATLFSEPVVLSAAADRMAYRFTGAKIGHIAGFNIVSDGIALGAIQIGGDGQPLILMADHQPTGGYPKIGTVIRADIGRLAQMRPGETCRFALCDMEAARAALFALEDAIAATACQPIAAGFSSQVLRSINLVDGVVDLRGVKSDQ